MNIREFCAWVLGLAILCPVLQVLIVATVAGERGVSDLFLKYIPTLFEVVTLRLAVVVDQISEVFEKWFLTKRIGFVCAYIILMEFAHGIMFAREDTKVMVREIVEDFKAVGRDIKEAFDDVFHILSNPWHLVGYVLFIYVVTLDPETISDSANAENAAQEGQKLGGGQL